MRSASPQKASKAPVPHLRARLDEIYDGRSRRRDDDPLRRYPAFDAWLARTEKTLKDVYGDTVDVSIETYDTPGRSYRRLFVYVRVPTAFANWIEIPVMLRLHADRIVAPFAPDCPLLEGEFSPDSACFGWIEEWIVRLLDGIGDVGPFMTQQKALRTKLRKKHDAGAGYIN